MFNKNLKYCSLILAILIISITPVSAVEMEEVAHAAEKYQEQSKQKMNFFNKSVSWQKAFN